MRLASCSSFVVVTAAQRLTHPNSLQVQRNALTLLEPPPGQSDAADQSFPDPGG